MATEQTTPAGQAVERLLNSVQYKHLVQGFERASGLELHAYTLDAVPQTIPFDPPAYCRTLQAGLDCPLYFDPRYHHASTPEVRDTCGGLGHVVIPVMDADGRQILNLVSDTARFGPVDMDQVAERAFRLKVFPDDLAAQAESVPMVSRERLLFAAQILFAGLHELAGGEAQRAGSLELLIRKAAAAAADEIPNAIVDTVIDFTGAEFAYIALLDDIGVPIAEASTLKSRAEWWRILSGMGQWVVHAEEAIEIPNVSESAWCRHLAGSPPPPAAVFGAPLMVGDRVFGAVVIGGAEMERLEHWRNSLTLFTDTTADAMLLCRRLLETGEGDMIDRYSGTYNLRFLEELLEKEISRAGRHNHELSVVLFRLINYPELIKELGPRAAEQVLVQMAELLRNNTRKVNSLARVGEAAFALVIPEADQIVAQRIADELRTLAQSATLGGGDASGKPAIKLMLRTRTVSNPSAVETALDNLVSLN